MGAPTKSKDDMLNDAANILRQKNNEISNLKKMLDAQQKENDTAEKIRQEIWGLSAHPPNPPAWIAGRGVRNGTRGGPISIWSDFHHGEVVSGVETGGMNEFNSKISKLRFTRLVNTTIDLCFNHMGRANVAYPGIVICLGGDMIGGDIHEELLATNDRTAHQSVNDLTDMLAGGLSNLADKFGRVFVPGVVGNHGRSTHKMRMKGRVFTNYDWSIYCNLEREFRKDPRIVVVPSNQADYHFNLFGHRYMLTHGDSLGVKGGDGIIGALGPIMRGKLKVGASESEMGRDFDTLIMGHWHQYITLPGLVCNNSLKGFDEYAHLQLRAKYSRPSQALWFTHPEHGITAHWQVYLEGLRNASANREWLTWQA